MAVLVKNLQDKINELEEQSYKYYEQGDKIMSYQLMEDAWKLYPEPKYNWNEAYNTSKYAFNDLLKDNEFNLAKKWLNRMIENNNNLHLSDIDIDFEIGKYYFETKDYPQAIEKWQYVEKEAGLRYFEGEKPEYLEFYKNPEKYLKK